jgi:hypothetical protein
MAQAIKDTLGIRHSPASLLIHQSLTRLNENRNRTDNTNLGSRLRE